MAEEIAGKGPAGERVAEEFYKDEIANTTGEQQWRTAFKATSPVGCRVAHAWYGDKLLNGTEHEQRWAAYELHEVVAWNAEIAKKKMTEDEVSFEAIARRRDSISRRIWALTEVSAWQVSVEDIASWWVLPGHE